MQVALRPYVLLGQCFGLLPVRGIFSDNPKNLMFTWKSKRTIYALLILALTVVFTVLVMIESLKRHSLGFRSLNDIVKGTLVISHLMIYLGQARTWPNLILEWSKIEWKMKCFHPILGLSAKIYLFTYLFCLGVFSHTMREFAYLHQCSEDMSVVFQLMVMVFNYQLFSITGFSFYNATITMILVVHRCLLVVYDELTIIVFSYSLYLRFRQLRLHLLRVTNQKMLVTNWAELREIYSQLSCLTKLLDDHLSWMTLICFGSNFYHICELLLKTLRFENNRMANWLSLYILIFELVRTFGAALIASTVHEESKKILPLLFSGSSNSYNGEVYRFQMQLSYDEITITGFNFFSLTRSFILTVAGTIATYEAVLLQFGTSTENDSASFNITVYCLTLMRLTNHK